MSRWSKRILQAVVAIVATSTSTEVVASTTATITTACLAAATESTTTTATASPCMAAFQVTLAEPFERDSMQRALTLIEKYYPHESTSSPISHHAFVRMAPTDLQQEIHNFVWNQRLLQVVPTNHNAKIYVDSFHEIYWMRPEFDLVDPNKIHYDGVLKISGASTIRSLTYLQGRTATLVSLTSQRNFTTTPGTMVVLDFNRELHYAHLTTSGTTSTTTTTTEPRIIIKAAIHVFPLLTHPVLAFTYICLHRILFFAIKSVRNTFESSSSFGFQQTLLMGLDNALRSLNKIHMALPLVAVGLPLTAFVVASVSHLTLALPYLMHIVITWWRNISPHRANCLRVVATGVALLLNNNHSKASLLWLHLAWMAVCWYLEQNANMAHTILFAPIPAPILYYSNMT